MNPAAKRDSAGNAGSVSNPPSLPRATKFNLMEDMGWVGTIYRMYFYRSVMRFIHRLGWCQMKPMPIIEPGERQRHWCQWCGMRGTK